MVNSAALDRTFAALADPTRRAIVSRLAHGEATVGELAAPFELTLPAVSKHVDVLVEAGLVKRERRGRFSYCRLDARPIRRAGDWMEFHEKLWSQQLEQLRLFLSRTDEQGER